MMRKFVYVGKKLYLCKRKLKNAVMKKIFMCMIAAFVMLACGHENEPENKKDDNKPEEKQEEVLPSMTLEQVSNIALHTCLSQNYFTEMYVEATSEWMKYAASQSQELAARKVAQMTKAGGPEISWDATNEQLVIDYGNGGVMTAAGDEIKGKIMVKCNGNYFEKGTKVQVIADKLQINDATLSGTEVVDNLGIDKDGNTYFNVKISDGTVQYANDTIAYEYKSESHRTLIVNGDTLNYYDHSYKIDVIKAVSLANGQWFNFKTYNEDLLIVPVASYPTAGTLSVTLKEPVVIDFSKFIPGADDSNKFTLETFYVKFAEDSEITVGIMLPYMTEMIELYKVKMSDFK